MPGKERRISGVRFPYLKLLLLECKGNEEKTFDRFLCIQKNIKKAQIGCKIRKPSVDRRLSYNHVYRFIPGKVLKPYFWMYDADGG
jgi:hypothetical protein